MAQKSYRVMRWVNHDNKDYFPGDTLTAEPDAVKEAIKVGAIYEDPSIVLPASAQIIDVPVIPQPPVVVATPPVLPDVTPVITPVQVTKKDK